MKLYDYDLILSDVDGVLVREEIPIKENIEALRKTIEKGKKVVLISNNSGFSRILLSRQLLSYGLPIGPDSIVTSGLATAIYLKEKMSIRSVYIVGEEGLVEEMRNHGFKIIMEESDKEIPDAVVLGLDRFVTYEKLSLAARFISKGSKFIVTNMDRLWPSKNGLKLGAGALASAIVSALKKEPDFVAGKPNPWMVEVAMRLSKIDNLEKVLVIGDQLETDIQMGTKIGADTVLVLTGISKKEDVEKSNIKPKTIVSNLLELI